MYFFLRPFTNSRAVTAGGPVPPPSPNNKSINFFFEKKKYFVVLQVALLPGIATSLGYDPKCFTIADLFTFLKSMEH